MVRGLPVTKYGAGSRLSFVAVDEPGPNLPEAPVAVAQYYAGTAMGSTDPGPPTLYGFAELENPVGSGVVAHLMAILVSGAKSGLPIYLGKQNGATRVVANTMLGIRLYSPTTGVARSLLKANGGNIQFPVGADPTAGPHLWYSQFGEISPSPATAYTQVLEFPGPNGIEMQPGGAVSMVHEEGAAIRDLLCSFIWWE